MFLAFILVGWLLQRQNNFYTFIPCAPFPSHILLVQIMNLSDNSYLKGDLDKQQLSYGSIKFQLLKNGHFPFFPCDSRVDFLFRKAKLRRVQKSIRDFNRPKVLAIVEFHQRTIIVVQTVLGFGSPLGSPFCWNFPLQLKGLWISSEWAGSLYWLSPTSTMHILLESTPHLSYAFLGLMIKELCFRSVMTVWLFSN